MCPWHPTDSESIVETTEKIERLIQHQYMPPLNMIRRPVKCHDAQYKLRISYCDTRTDGDATNNIESTATVALSVFLVKAPGISES